MRRRAGIRGAAGWLALAAALVAPWSFVPSSDADDEPVPGADLYLVTLRSPGTSGYDGSLTSRDYRAAMLAQQDGLLDQVDDGEPVYRWTTALNGFAVHLTAPEAGRLAAQPQVRLVERDTVRPVTGTSSPASAPSTSAVPPTGDGGGRGTVIGFVDTGVHPHSPVFAYTSSLGPRPRGFHGECASAGQWDDSDCNDKIIAARHFVAGFGAGHLRSGADTSPYDDDGHGTQLASLAAGNAGVNALDGDQNHGTFSGTAPQARVAVYKACWSAPDPDDDGCSSADVVAAVDAAVADRVDVLNVAVAGSPSLDTVDLALLGAAERDVFVSAAAGNDGARAGHPQPWVTTVGGTSGPRRTGALTLEDGTVLSGAMTATRDVGPARIVPAGDIPAPGRSAREARYCLPGALDAGRAAGRLVVCDRGLVARVDKSAAVRLADGVGMVLVNRRGNDLGADFHALPSLHLGAADSRALRSALARPGPLTGRLAREATPKAKPRMLPTSGSGSGSGASVKPDLVAPGAELLAATSPAGSNARWELTTGTSAATARVSGWAARVRAAHPDWSAARIRSALVTSSTSVGGEPGSLRQGAGLPRPEQALRPGLVYDVRRGAWRRALNRQDAESLNLPSVLLADVRATATVNRRVTNVGGRSMYYSAQAWGFTSHRVRVTPAALRIGPGETRTVRIRVAARPGVPPAADSGWVAWRGANGTRARIPVVLAY
jgi:hypothetical protein